MAPYSPTPKAISPVVALTMTWWSVEVEAVKVSTTVHNCGPVLGVSTLIAGFVPVIG